MQKDLADISATKTQVVGISFDKIDILKGFAAKAKITFPLLSDSKSEVIKGYGVHHQRGYPHPITYLIDQSGVVRAALSVDGYRTRHPNAELIAAAGKMKAK